MRLSQTAIQNQLPWLTAEVLQEVDSTNSEARRRIKAGLTEPLLLTAEHQTAGRGRQGKTFYSPAGTGIYMTLVLHPNVPLTDAVSVTTRTSVAVCRAIRNMTDLRPEIKWVNDLYLYGKKICGILVEAISDYQAGITQTLIIGVGINVTTQSFPEELQEAASLCVEVDRNRLIAGIAEELRTELSDWKSNAYLGDYRNWSMVLGKPIVWTQNGVVRNATALEIDDRGGLVIQNEDGSRHTLSSGEISVRLS